MSAKAYGWEILTETEARLEEAFSLLHRAYIAPQTRVFGPNADPIWERISDFLTEHDR